jgi:hypothetical protein
VSTDLTTYQGLLDVQTGELLEPTVGNAARCISAARAMKQHVNEIVNEATAYLVALSEHQGTKTLHGEGETITVTGAPAPTTTPQICVTRSRPPAARRTGSTRLSGQRLRTRSTGPCCGNSPARTLITAPRSNWPSAR